MKKIIMLFLITSISINIFANNNFKNEFLKANDLYSKKNFKEALNIYLAILKKGYNNFNVNYNIGCCYYNMQEFGKSRFYFEKALSYKPFDKDLKNNLTILYNKFQMPSLGEQIIMAKRVIYFFPTPIVILLLSALIILSIFFAFYSFFSIKNRKIYFIFFVITFVFTIIFNIFFFSQYIDYNTKTFVCTSKLTNIFAVPSDYETILQTIQEGTSGKVVEDIDRYIKINLSNGTSGWIKKEDVIYLP
jgi:tetratricopeptide (TPR) repeat protein